MRRNVHYFWPRAESNLYLEPKRLQAAGLATSRAEPVGRRRRTVYAITEEGTRALQHWLTRPAAGSHLESEVMVKVMFGNHAQDLTTVLTNLEASRSALEKRERVFVGIFDEYLRDEDQFPERLHVNVLCYRLLWDLTRTELNWTNWAIDRIAKWKSPAAPGERRTHLAVLAEILAERKHSGRAAAAGPPGTVKKTRQEVRL